MHDIVSIVLMMHDVALLFSAHNYSARALNFVAMPGSLQGYYTTR